MTITYLHLGYPKTASTYLQLHVFNNMNANFIGRPYSHDEYYDIEKKIITYSDKNFHKEFSKILDAYKVKTIKKINILSIENILLGNVYNSHAKNNIFRTIKRYKLIFSQIGKVKILFAIRSHTELIKSMYYQYNSELFKYHKIKSKNLIEFFTKKNKKCDFIFKTLNFHTLHAFLKKEFNKKNVKMLFYEDLESNYNKYIAEISKFIKINENTKFQNKYVNKTTDNLNIYLQFIKLFKKKNITKFYQLPGIILNKLHQLKIAFINMSFAKKMKKNEKLIKKYYKKDLLLFKEKDIKHKLKIYNYL